MEEFKVEGLDELLDKLGDLSDKYPEKAGKLLQSEARQIRKNTILNLKAVKKSKGDVDYKPLTKVQAYKISKPMGRGSDQYVTIQAVARHFHLVEHGHQLVSKKTNTVNTKNGKKVVILSNGGKNIGYVPGVHMLANATKKADGEFPKHAKKMVEKLIKEAKL